MPLKSSKAKDNLKALERRLKLWKQGNLNKFLLEAMSIQKSLKTIFSSRVIGETSKTFSNLMDKRNVNAAIKLLTNNLQNGILPIHKGILDLLIQKHPKGEPAHESVLLTDTTEELT